MNKELFSHKTELIMNALLESTEQGVYKTTECLARLDDLFDSITDHKFELSFAQQKVVHDRLKTRMVQPKDREVRFKSEVDLIDEFEEQARREYQDEKGQ